jgi:hypothetical protein
MQGMDGLVTLLDKFDLKIKGMDRGRDIATDAHKGKDDQIRELEDRVESLEKEAVIAGLNVCVKTV